MIDRSRQILPSSVTAHTRTNLRRTQRRLQLRRRKGAAAVLAMVFLTLFATLSVAMISLSSLNAQSASNLADVEKARAIAEAGLRWQAYRLRAMPRPKTTAGTITSEVAKNMWPDIKTSITNDYASMSLSAERTAPVESGNILTCPEIALDSSRSQRFQIHIERDTTDYRYLHVTSTGTYGNTTRKVSMTFNIDKKVKFAIVGKVPIQIGRNTIVEGNVAMAIPKKYPPILMLSDFMHFDSSLATKITAWNNFLKSNTTVSGVAVKNHQGYDNRINVNNKIEYQIATAAGYVDYNNDSYIDEYDLFVKHYDRDNNKAISKSEFTNPSTGKLYDAELFAAMDSTGAPMFAGDVTRIGYRDGVIDNSDGYAKVRGTLTLAEKEADWSANLASSNLKINDMIQGTVAVTNPTDVAVKFGATQSELFDLAPENFEACADGFRARTGSNAGAAVRNTSQRRIENTTLSVTDASIGIASVQVTSPGNTSFTAGQIVSKTAFDAANNALSGSQTKATATAGDNKSVERTPFGSTSWQATYQRPVFNGVTFKNVVIPKGLNAVFTNCTFEGVTFVESERNITKSGGTVTTNKDDGLNWAKTKIKGANFSANTPLVGADATPVGTQTSTNGSTTGNNLRFNDCTFKGPLAGNYATAYTHFANSWEFTGATMFDNQVDQTATIVSPQVNIEMGSFTDPNAAPSTLIGVVVAGNIDIRGYSSVDGSIIITGDGAGNTTLAYFGASDSDTNASAMPEGGYGKLNIRYNPNRTLPDGINIAVDILPDPTTYKELRK